MVRLNDAREQLVPSGGPNGEPSCSPSHSFPRYELQLPGTMQSSDGAPPAAEACDSVRNGDASGRGAVAVEPMPPAAKGPAPGPAAAAAAAATPPELMTSPRPPVPSAGGSNVVAAMEIQEALLPLQPAAPFEHPISLPQRRWMVFMFCLVAALLFADQNLLAPNLTAAADYFGLNERQKDTLLGGALMAAFFAVGAPAALLVGWLTDRGDINRRTLLFWVVVLGETPCLLTYWVKAYWQFFLLRAMTGVAVGGCFPLVFSLLGDLYPPKRRAAVSAVVQIATGIGLAVGQALSGSIGPATNWRVPFVVVAAPSLAAALLMLLTTREPPRGAFEEALQERYAEGLGSYEGSISWSKVAALLRCPSNVLVIGQGLPGSLPWGMVLTYFNDFLAQQKGFTVQAATGVLLFFAGGGAVGVIGGGAGGQWLYNRRKEYQALLAGGSVLVGIAPLYVLINADLQRVGLAGTCFLAALGGAVASVAGPNLRSVMLNVNEPETRGMALAFQSMTDDLGKGLGPVLVAGLIHAMGREGAFNVATAGWIPCGLMLAALACFMRRDEAAMQARLGRNSDALQAAQAAARAAAAGGGDEGGEGGGITVMLPPPSPAAMSEGGAAAGGAAAADTVGAVAALRREERRLAKVRLLAGVDGGGGGSSSSDHAPLPLSSSAAELEVEGEGGRWGRGAAVGFAARAAEQGPGSVASDPAVVIATGAAAPPGARSTTDPPTSSAFGRMQPQVGSSLPVHGKTAPPPHDAHTHQHSSPVGYRPPDFWAGPPPSLPAETGTAGYGPGGPVAAAQGGVAEGARVQREAVAGGGGGGDASGSGRAGGATGLQSWPGAQLAGGGGDARLARGQSKWEAGARGEGPSGGGAFAFAGVGVGEEAPCGTAARDFGTGGPPQWGGGSVVQAGNTAGVAALRQDPDGEISGAPARGSVAASLEAFWGTPPSAQQQQQQQLLQQEQAFAGPALEQHKNGVGLNDGGLEGQGEWRKPSA